MKTFIRISGNKINNMRILATRTLLVSLIFVIVLVNVGCQKYSGYEDGDSVFGLKFKESHIPGFLESNDSFESIYDISVINGQPAFFFSGINGNKRKGVFYDGKILGEQYNFVRFPREINGKIAFDADGLVYYDGKEYGKEFKTIYLFTNLSKGLAFVAELNNGSIFIVYDGKYIGGEYDLISNLYKGLIYVSKFIEVNGTLAYEVGQIEKRFIVYGDKVIGSEYDWAGSPFELNGKLAYLSRNNSQFFAVYDGNALPMSNCLENINQAILNDIPVYGALEYSKFTWANDSLLFDGKLLDNDLYLACNTFSPYYSSPTFKYISNENSSCICSENVPVVKAGNKLVYVIETESGQKILLQK